MCECSGVVVLLYCIFDCYGGVLVLVKGFFLW